MSAPEESLGGSCRTDVFLLCCSCHYLLLSLAVGCTYTSGRDAARGKVTGIETSIIFFSKHAVMYTPPYTEASSVSIHVQVSWAKSLPRPLVEPPVESPEQPTSFQGATTHGRDPLLSCLSHYTSLHTCRYIPACRYTHVRCMRVRVTPILGLVVHAPRVTEGTVSLFDNLQDSGQGVHRENYQTLMWATCSSNHCISLRAASRCLTRLFSRTGPDLSQQCTYGHACTYPCVCASKLQYFYRCTQMQVYIHPQIFYKKPGGGSYVKRRSRS